MWTSFKRIVRAGFVGFWRNAFVSLSAVFVMTVTLFVVGSMSLLGVLLDESLAQVQNKVDVNVYFDIDTPETAILDLQTEIESLPEVKEVAYTSRAEELVAFRERHQSDTFIIQALEELGDNPLSASLSITAEQTSQYEGIAEFLEDKRKQTEGSAPFIDRINYFQNKNAIDKLTGIIGAVEQSSFIAMIVLVVASVLITFNTIRLAIYTNREEISVMRLVGAGNSFIRGPFMLQGILYGLISGVLTLLILYPLVLWIGPATEVFFQFNIFTHYVNDFGHMFVLIVGSGVVLGIVSSLMAVARYLRV